MKKVITVRFKQSGKTYYFDPAGMDIKTGDHVIVETARGTECAEVVQGVREVPDSQVVKQLKSVTRMADAVDVRRMRQNREDEKRAFKICEERIARHKLEMKLVDVEYTLDRSKILFYFIADGRIDFRELVKDLAGVFRARIELRWTCLPDQEDPLAVFTRKGITVVSGMAWGIDKASHEASLGRTGSSIAVLGTGIDVPYPRANTRLYDRMAAKGLLVSEFAPGTPALRENFPVRNRIISGLSLGVVVVEAASRSGTLITSRLALEQGREVYAVPGAALSGQSLGCQELVRQGAKPVFAPEDVLEDLAGPLRDFGVQADHLTREAAERRRRAEAEGTGLSRTLFACMPPETDTPPKADSGNGEERPTQGAGDTDTAAASPAQDTIIPLLREQGPLHVDALGAALGRSPAELAPVLLGLEIMGRIRRLPGARYEAV